MNALRMRGIRGAITVDVDAAPAIVDATKRLLRAIVERNAIELDDIASALFSLTPDLHAALPALGAREMGWVRVPRFVPSHPMAGQFRNYADRRMRTASPRPFTLADVGGDICL